MNYNTILQEIQPNQNEKDKINQIVTKILNKLNQIFKEKNIDAKASIVGSVAKETFLSGKSDIDIFIRFPLNTKEKQLKKYGLEIAYQCIEEFNGKSEEHYASHPYLTGIIENYEIDFVPCYDIKDATELKSAVDRTILHTKYIKANLKEEQKKEVLLLKRFMDKIGTYGSEFKIGGFAGYLCEMLIIFYGTFENTLKNSQNWKYKTIIDLEKYNTSKNFKDPLIAIDPTDKNRNVGAALTLEKMIDFIIASRNYLNETDENKKISYFYDLNKEKINKEEIIKQFKERENHTLVLKFPIPEITQDSLYPQLKKTLESLTSKIEKEDFKTFKTDYWSDDEEYAFFILELNVYTQTKYKIQKGPKIWTQKACNNFKNAHKDKNIYILNDYLVFNTVREFKTPEEYILNVLTKENVHKIKIGRNLTSNLLNHSKLLLLDDFLNSKDFDEYEYSQDLLNFLDDFLNPNQYIIR